MVIVFGKSSPWQMGANSPMLNMMIEANFSDISYSGIPNSLMQDLMTGKIK